MVENGKIVSIREFVKNKYKDRYESAGKFKESEQKIENEIAELKKTKAIAVTRKLEDGKLVIPGLDLSNRDELQRLTALTRRISRNATGSLSDGDINKMSMSIWTKSMMLFKNWIPKLTDTRFSEFRKVADDFSVEIGEDGIPIGEKYDIGRIRLLASVIGSSFQDKSTNLINILKMNDKGIEKLNSMYEEYKAEYESSTGETLNMTKEEFIDMVRSNLHNQMKELAMLGALISMMLFKNWIPKLTDTRFSEFRKVADDFSVEIGEDGIPIGEKYDIGRIRLLSSVIVSSFQDKANNLINILKMNDEGIKKLNDMYEEYKAEYESSTGETLNMSKEAFIDMVRSNLHNQMKELAMLGALMSMMFAMGFIAPDDDDDKASKNFHRFTIRVMDKFVSELSFFYNPVNYESLLSGSIFPAAGLISDMGRFVNHTYMETTGLDMDLSTSQEDVRKKAQPIKYGMKMLPFTKSLVTYLAIFDSEFAKEYDVTIQKESR
jgi:hypothetical protein